MGRLVMSENDIKVVNFIEDYKVATTDTISQLFYSSLRYGQYRLKLMYDNKVLKRDREHFTNQYYYYIRKPRQLRHSLLLTDFYREMNKVATIERFKKEFAIDRLRADGLIAYEYKSNHYLAFIEIQIANMPLDISKYEKLYNNGKYKIFFGNVFPQIIAITNKKTPKTKLSIIKVNEDFLNLREVL